MKIGDFVWFKRRDDVYCERLEDFDSIYVAGKILRESTKGQIPIFWLASLPLPFSGPLALWAIPKTNVIAMKDEEAMLAILEEI